MDFRRDFAYFRHEFGLADFCVVIGIDFVEVGDCFRVQLGRDLVDVILALVHFFELLVGGVGVDERGEGGQEQQYTRKCSSGNLCHYL